MYFLQLMCELLYSFISSDDLLGFYELLMEYFMTTHTPEFCKVCKVS